MTILAILGGARGNGDTQALVAAVLGGRATTTLDLRQLDIQHYEYEGELTRDDFATVVDAMQGHERIVFVTPVYWYAMSGRLKVLFDRFTDLVTVRKDLGRALAGRTIFVLATGSEPALPDGFEVPFRRTAEYLGMAYGGAFYTRTGNAGTESGSAAHAASVFGHRILAETAASD